MKPVRIPGLARSSRGSGAEHIRKLTGYAVVREGDDWIIPADDPQLLSGPKPLLQTSKPIPLGTESYESTATNFVENYLSTFEQWRPEPPKTINLFSDFGLLSEFQEIHHRFFFEEPDRLRRALAEKFLPFMHKRLHAGRVAPLKISVEEQYGIVALAKIAYMARQFGFEKAATLVQKNAMSSVLPSANDVVSYVQGLLTFIPLASTVPLDRMGSQLHFFSPRGSWAFPPEATQGVFQVSSARSSPICELGRPPFIALTDHINQRYFLLAVEATNRLLKFVNDPRQFQDHGGEIRIWIDS